MSKEMIYVGTIAGQGSQGIYRFTLDTLKGTLDGPSLVYECPSSKALCYDQAHLAFACEQGKQAGVTLLEIEASEAIHLDTKLTENTPSCAIAQDEHFLYTANYHEGSVLIYRKAEDSLKLEKRLDLGEDAKCHQAYVLNHNLYVICLGTDRIRIYDIENHFSFVKDICLPKGCGPRQIAVDEQQKHMYIISELSNEVFVYAIGAHYAFRCEQICSVLPNGEKENCASAAIRLSPNGRYLYTSTRGADIITVFEVINGNLRQKEIIQCGGKHPRDFIIDETGRWLLVLNRDSNNIVVFKIDPDSGEALEITDEKEISQGVAITLAQ